MHISHKSSTDSTTETEICRTVIVRRQSSSLFGECTVFQRSRAYTHLPSWLSAGVAPCPIGWTHLATGCRTSALGRQNAHLRPEGLWFIASKSARRCFAGIAKPAEPIRNGARSPHSCSRWMGVRCRGSSFPPFPAGEAWGLRAKAFASAWSINSFPRGRAFASSRSVCSVERRGFVAGGTS